MKTNQSRLTKVNNKISVVLFKLDWIAETYSEIA